MTTATIRMPISCLLLLLLALVGVNDITASEPLGSPAYSFVPNQGQWPDAANFRLDAGGATVWFTQQGIHYQFMRPIGDNDSLEQSSPDGHLSELVLNQKYELLTVTASFLNANIAPEIAGESRREFTINYLIGNDPDRWHTNIPAYRKIVYSQLYDGIDLAYYTNSSDQLEYDYIVAPGVDPSAIQIQYDNIEGLALNAEGSLVINTPWGELTEQRPLLYQLVDGDRVVIDGQYRLLDDNSFGFEPIAPYRADRPLVIDPVIGFSTYLGGSGIDYGQAIDVDGSGNMYAAVSTTSPDFPVVGGVQDTLSFGYDVALFKLSGDGTTLVYATYLGGDADDWAADIAVDNAGAAYLTGRTASSDFPTLSGYQVTFGGGSSDGFATKISATGDALVYSTFIGGTDNDDGFGLELNAAGEAFVSGRTGSTDFPVKNAYQSTYGGGANDGFVLRLGADGDSLIYSTYLGGSDWDWSTDIAIDESDYAYVASTTAGSFPTKDAVQPTFGGGTYDGAVTKLGPDGDSLVFSTFVGGSAYDACYAIYVDINHKVYYSGNTGSADFPTVNAYDDVHGGGTYNGFVCKLTSGGDTLTFSTYIGNATPSWWDVCYGIGVDMHGRVYVSGMTNSTVFPTVDPIQVFKSAGTDGWAAAFDESGGILYSTYVGGPGSDNFADMKVEADGKIYIIGYSDFGGFPTVDPYQDTVTGEYDVILFTFDGLPVSVDEYRSELLPEQFTLAQNYPNPFNPTTSIQFDLPQASEIKLQVFNVIGQEIAVLAEGFRPAGEYTVTWKAKNYSSGIYFYRLTTDYAVETRKMVLLK